MIKMASLNLTPFGVFICLFSLICFAQIVGFRNFCNSLFQVFIVSLPKFFVYVLPTLAVSYWSFYFLNALELGAGAIFLLLIALAIFLWMITLLVYVRWGERIKEFSMEMPYKLGYSSGQNPFYDYDKKVDQYGDAWEEAEGRMLFSSLQESAKAFSKRHHWFTALLVSFIVYTTWDWSSVEWKNNIPILGHVFSYVVLFDGWLSLIFLAIVGAVINSVSRVVVRVIPYWDFRRSSFRFLEYFESRYRYPSFNIAIKGTSLLFTNIHIAKDVASHLGVATKNKQIYKAKNGILSFVIGDDVTARQISRLALIMNKYGSAWIENASDLEISSISGKLST